MEGSNSNSKTASFSLPPGCRFYPSEEQLFCHYLTKKNTNTEEESSPCGYDLIKELDLYQYEPYDLPERACYPYGYRARKRHWYCYSEVRVKKENRWRRAKNGYWRRKERVRDVIVGNNSNNNNNNNKGGKLVLGTKTSFVFYLGNSLKTAVRTDWFMHEYALVDHVKASFVLCRVFIKARAGNSISEVGLSSGAEESVSAVRHIGIQHYGILKPDFILAKVHDDDSLKRQNDTSRYPGQLDGQFDDHAISGPVSDASFQFSPGIPPNDKVSTSGLTGAAIFSDAVAAQQLLSILEEDFIELDDLVP